MAIDNFVKRKIGEQIANWVYLGIKTGARRYAEMYEQQKATNLDEGIKNLKYAINKPHETRQRINQFISTYGQPYLVECMNLYSSDVTLAEFNAELTQMENYC